jgi:hypothetical protein
MARTPYRGMGRTTCRLRRAEHAEEGMKQNGKSRGMKTKEQSIIQRDNGTMVDFSQSLIAVASSVKSGAPPVPQPAEGRLKSGREGEHEASSQRLI